jgi:hypothetical protein
VWGSGAQPSNARLRDGLVYREAGPWSPTVLALLRHLEEVGFAGAPRMAGSGFAAGGREMLSFIPGVSPQPYAWNEDAVAGWGCSCGSCMPRPRRSSRRLAPAGSLGSGATCLGRNL